MYKQCSESRRIKHDNLCAYIHVYENNADHIPFLDPMGSAYIDGPITAERHCSLVRISALFVLILIKPAIDCSYQCK